ncbi:MAG TPA: hypothetical protein VFW98_10865 [Gemmatimonadaceae bacterium]|nr:hypothetical protein [Gemmatimonadaceae bacterium]
MVARLDIVRDPEELAADLIEVWPSIETALRSLLGGSPLSGQALIHEVRQRELISLEQAHALVGMLAVRERVDHGDYHPTESDIAATRDGYAALEAALSAARPDEATAEPSVPARVGQTTPTGPMQLPLVTPPHGPRRAPWVILGAVVVLIIVAAAVTYVYITRYGVQGEIRAGMRAYAGGQRAVARLAFTQASHEHPELLVPHLYLARMAREDGDFVTAAAELGKAAKSAPRNALVERELGAYFLARGEQDVSQGRQDLAATDFDAARRRYVSALGIDSTDKSAQGYLGCALVKLGRTAEGQQWLSRAGPGGWAVCAPSADTTGP